MDHQLPVLRSDRRWGRTPPLILTLQQVGTSDRPARSPGFSKRGLSISGWQTRTSRRCAALSNVRLAQSGRSALPSSAGPFSAALPLIPVLLPPHHRRLSCRLSSRITVRSGFSHSFFDSTGQKRLPVGRRLQVFPGADIVTAGWHVGRRRETCWIEMHFHCRPTCRPFHAPHRCCLF